ncbi:MAG: hypothetical protein EAX86_02740 [Candidatus Heimdallarchaeota archaeon]|nr:hypothetical protein [Candidatus Heimdallarchaeota archaeon]
MKKKILLSKLLNELTDSEVKKMNGNQKIADINQKSPSFLLKVKEHMLETLKIMYNSMRYPEFKFTRSGLIISIILIIASALIFLIPLIIGEIKFLTFSIPANLLGIPISLLVAFLVIYLWFLLGLKVTPIIAHLLVDNKVLTLLFTKGNVHYVEYVPLEKRKIAFPHILNKYIALIVAWVSVSAFLLNLLAGFVAGGDPRLLVSPGENIFFFILRTVVLFVFVPIIFTGLYPIGWMLIDAKLKAYNSVTQLNWLIGKKVLNITAGIITIGSVLALGASVIEYFAVRAQLIVDLLLFCVVNISLIVSLVTVFYNMFFQGKFYQNIIDSLNVGYGITSVTLVDAEGLPIHNKEEEETLVEKPLEEVKKESMHEISSDNVTEVSRLKEDHEEIE